MRRADRSPQLSGSTSAARAIVARRAGRAPRLHETAVCFEVPFHDVDALGIVWHGHYFKYLELARTALMRARGLDARDLLALGVGMMVIDSRCRHSAPLRYGERARATAWFRDVTHRICIEYEVRKLACETRVARARTVLASVTPAGELLFRTPDAVLARIRGDAP